MPYGRDLRGAGGSSDQCSVIAQNSFRFGFKHRQESLIRTVCGSEFRTENWKAHLKNSVIIIIIIIIIISIFNVA